jgi:2-phospho-L-lactate guanylyltransferase (CobY/MobA/RfbA family)
MPSSLWIVVLIKDFTTAKSRLEHVMEPRRRRRLAEMTAARALDAAAAVAPTLAVC